MRAEFSRGSRRVAFRSRKYLQRAFRGGMRLYKNIMADDIPGLAMQLSYSLLMAAFPFMVLLISIFGRMAFTQDAEYQFFSALPRETSALLKNVLIGIMQNRSIQMVSINALLLVFSVSFSVNSLIKGMNRAYACRETRPWYMLLGISMLFTLALVLVSVAAFSLAVFDFHKIIEKFYWEAAKSALTWVTYIIVMAIEAGTVFLVMLLIYFYIPNRRIPVRETLPGAVIATISWIILTYAYTAIMNRFQIYAANYGSIAGIIMLLVWMNLITTVVLAGAEINAIRGGILVKRR